MTTVFELVCVCLFLVVTVVIVWRRRHAHNHVAPPACATQAALLAEFKRTFCVAGSGIEDAWFAGDTLVYLVSLQGMGEIRRVLSKVPANFKGVRTQSVGGRPA
ncbi:MAG: hypothetical protein K2W82_17995 [Candidatus Obscuribacterales bacterium]|nr:hypothetical protein [Candidatus Obscuribacterales bacterium]